MSFRYSYSQPSLSRRLISNNLLPSSENLVPVLKWKSNNRQKNIVEKRRNCSKGAISPLFHNIFNISLTSGVKLHIQLFVLLFSLFLHETHVIHEIHDSKAITMRTYILSWRNKKQHSYSPNLHMQNPIRIKLMYSTLQQQ